MREKSLKIAKELSDLVIYCQPVTFDWDLGAVPFLLIFFAFIVCFILFLCDVTVPFSISMYVFVVLLVVAF